MPNNTRERRLAMAQKETLRELSEESRNDTLEIMKAMRYAEKDGEVLAKALAKKYSRNLEKTAGIADLKSDLGMDEEDQKDEQSDFASDDEESVAPAAEEGEEDKEKPKAQKPKGKSDEDDDDNVEFEEDVEESPIVNEKEFDLSPNEEVVLDLPGNGEIIVRFNPKGDDEEEEMEGEEPGELMPVDEAGEAGEFGGGGELGGVGEIQFPFGDVGPEDSLGGEEMSEEKLAHLIKQMQRLAAAEEKADGPNNNVKPNPDKNLGDDTARSGDGRGTATTKPFKTEDAQNGPVADHGKDGATMRLQRDGGNSLKSDPGFQTLKVPTHHGDLLMQDNMNDAMVFSGDYGDLVKQSIDSSDLQIPTEGGAGFPEFELPTQLPETTKQRKTIVAEVLASLDPEDRKVLAELLVGEAAESETEAEPLSPVEAAVSEVAQSLIARGVAREMFAQNENPEVVMRKKANRECDAYANEAQEPVDDWRCEDCGAKVVLCTSAQNDGYCPACATIVKEAQRIVEAELETGDWGDEFCADERGEDPNGDGGFRTQDKKGKMPLDKNARDVELRNATFEKEAANEIDYWKRAFAEERVKASRYAQAVKTAAKMYAAGMVEGRDADTAIDGQAQELMAQGLDVHAMKYLEDQVITIAAQRNHERARMARAASTQESPGLMTAIAMRQPAESKSVDIVSELSNVFTRPRLEDWDEDGKNKIR